MIRLCMLARDEADRIADVAAACAGMFDDYVVLVDARTTDDTEAAIERELGDEGRIVPFKFRDFADARNQLFHHARPGLKPTDYMLLADPDSPPRGQLPAELGAEVYDCEWRSGDFTYRLPILVRADVPARYEGACHELMVGWQSGYAPLPDVWVDVQPKAASPGRLAEYLTLLEPEADTNPRSAFYLARTLADLGRPLEAWGAYLKRAQMIGWVEETYLSLLTAGILVQPYDLAIARSLLERARAYRPERLEGWYHLARLANLEHRHGDAAELAIAGLRMPRSTDRLFVDRQAERDGLQAQLALALGELAASASAATLTPL